MATLTEFLKITGNPFATIAADGITAGDVSSYVDSGSYALNALLSGSIYGGFPGNKIIVIGAPPSTGKCARGSQELIVYFKENYETVDPLFSIRTTYKLFIENNAPLRKIDEMQEIKEEFFIKTPSGSSKIIGVIEKSPTIIIRVLFEDDSIFECAETHLFTLNGETILAKDAEIVDTVYGKLKIIEKTVIGIEPVFDISIESPHLYISDASGIIHHNSFFALGAAKHFLEQNPTGMVLLFESESAITKDMLVERGIDTKRFGVIPVATVQEFRNQALKIISNYEKDAKKDRQPLFFILDSLGMLSTAKEMTDSAEGNDTRDMTRAQLIKASFRVLTLRLGMANIPMFVTNHVYDAIGAGPYASKVQGGGAGTVYASSTILTLTKAKEKDSSNEVIGVIISVTASKSRLTKENSKVKCLIRYDGGLDRYYGLLELAEEAKIFNKVTTRYELRDGSKIFGKAIMANPEKYFTKEILDELDEFCKKKFLYGAMNHDELFTDEEEVE